MKQHLALLFLLVPIIGHAQTTDTQMKSITQCASSLPNDSYRMAINFDVKNGKTIIKDFSVTDGSSQEIGEVPHQQLIEFTKCITPFLSINKTDISLEK
ncbi:hypothetical protein [Photobacterium leiognathi]|uniref:hypothetical protein n=1 Tax=Photobacterium leiognathi TaxID=553611 RepID=UPI00273A4324|nr:hypothetical protein [Photobacterium leiognathi]